MTVWESTDIYRLISCIESGGRPKGGASEDSGEVPSLGGENIRQSGGLDLESVKKVPLAFFERMSKGILEHEDVLLNKDGANTGKVGLYESQYSRASINEHLFRLRGDSEKLTQRFLYYLLLSPMGQENIRARISGSAQPGLKRDFIRDFPVHVPASTKEQSGIADVLATIDRAIEQTEALIAKYRRIKTGLMHNLLTRGIEDGHLRNPATYRFKDSPLGKIPEIWRVSSVESEFELATGFTLGQHRRPRKNKRRYLRVANVLRERIVLDDIAELEATDEEMAGRVLCENDLLIVEGHASQDEIGRCARVAPEAVGLTFQNHLFRLRGRSINPRFALAWLNGEWMRAHWRRLCGTSSGLNTINSTMLKAVPVPVPPGSEQDEIATILEYHDICIYVEEAMLEKLHRLKTGLMQDLLTGKVPVTPLLGVAEGEFT